MTPINLKMIAASLTALVVLAPGAGRCGEPEKKDKADAKSAAPRTDRHGDPLPPGALARLGTIQQRVDAWVVGWADRRTILTCDRQRCLRWWDARTGKLRKRRDWPGPEWRRVHLSPDGKVLAAEEMKGLLTIWDVATGKCLLSDGPFRWNGDYPIAFSPDSRRLAVVNKDDNKDVLYLYDLATGRKRVLGKLPGAWDVALSSDNKRFLWYSGDRMLHCGDLATGKELWKAENAASRAIFSPDGRTVAASTDIAPDGSIRFLDAATGQPTADGRTIKLPPTYVHRFSPDGRMLAIGIVAGDTVIRDLATGKERLRLSSHHGSFSPDGTMLAGAKGVVLQCWDLTTGKPLFADTSALGHLYPPSAIVYSPDGKLMASASLADRSVRLWEVATGRPRHIRNDCVSWGMGGISISTSPDPVFLLFTLDSKRLLVADQGGKVSVWDTATGEEVRRLLLCGPAQGGELGRLVALQLSGDGAVLTAVTLHGEQPLGPRALTRWDFATGKPMGPPTPIPMQHYHTLTTDGRVFLIKRDAGGDDVHDLDGDIHLACPPRTRVGSFTGHRLIVSPDGAFLAAPLYAFVKKGEEMQRVSRGVQVWEALTGKPIIRLTAPDAGQAAFSPDSRRLAVIGPDDIRLFNLATGKELLRRSVESHLLGVHPGFEYGCPPVFAPDGRGLATALSDTTITIWDMAAPTRPNATPRPALTAAQQDALWADLGGDDAARAHVALQQLAERPGQSVVLLRQRLRPVAPLPAERLQRLIADLDSSEYEKREAASRRLAALRPLADTALRDALCNKPSLELRRRVEDLLSVRARELLTAERLRGLRAVRLLEQIATPAARAELRALAGGDRNARLTQAARDALRRLAVRPPPG